MAAIRTRPLENLLKFKPKNRKRREHLYKKLITALVQYERIETTINRCHDLSRVAERVSACMSFTNTFEHMIIIIFQ